MNDYYTQTHNFIKSKQNKKTNQLISYILLVGKKNLEEKTNKKIMKHNERIRKVPVKNPKWNITFKKKNAAVFIQRLNFIHRK